MKHGLTGTPEYWAWRDIKKRCFNPKNLHYHNYGGRGITMDESWIKDFNAFYESVGPKPGKGYSIDRIDNDGNYEPGNCRWATKQQQDNNRRSNHIVSYQGREQTIAMWAREIGVHPTTLYYRISKYGWPLDRALSGK